MQLWQRYIQALLLRSQKRVFGLLCLGMACLVFVACNRPSNPRESTGYLAFKQKMNNLMNKRDDIPYMDSLLKVYKGNPAAEMWLRLELGRRYRESSEFEKAIEQHTLALDLANQSKDTITLIQVLNQLGTDYRRRSDLDNASNMHYQALQYCDLYSERHTDELLECRVTSLNGIGNVQLSQGNLTLAEESFQDALTGVRKLQSNLGMAINYANIGSIKEKLNELDSAQTYYQHSMEHNRLAGSELGVALSYNNLGQVAEKRGQLDEAAASYQEAYNLLLNNKDRWHWLESGAALTRIRIKQKKYAEARQLLDSCIQTATRLSSPSHLADLYVLSAQYHEEIGQVKKALEDMKQSKTFFEKSINQSNIEHTSRLSSKYFNERIKNEVASVQQAFQYEARMKRYYLYGGITAVAVAVGFILILIHLIRLKNRAQRYMRKTQEDRQQFYTNITHEFRTPLSVILGLARQLENGDVCKSGNAHATGRVIAKQGESLLELINQLLDISKVQSGLGHPEWRKGDVVNYLRMIIESFQDFTRQRHITLLYIPKENSVVADFIPDFLLKVVRNLISNAYRNTPEYGMITVTTHCQDGYFVLQVIDTGKGIPPENLKDIFTPFYKGDDNKIGTGIGLSLVKQIVDFAKGKIDVESQLGKGSTFTISFPLIQGDSKWEPLTGVQVISEKGFEKDDIDVEPSPQTPAPEAMHPDNQPRILIVEDNEDISYYISTVLRNKNQIYFAKNGAEALEKAKDIVPDIIITDVMMPELDGYKLCAEIRGNDILNHIPIIIISAKSSQADRIRGFEAGANYYLTKPFSADELTTIVYSALQNVDILRCKYSQALHEGLEHEIQLNNGEQQFINKFIDLVYARTKDGHPDVEQIASDLCMSRAQLNRKITAITGQNTSAYISQIRMSKAKRLLDSDVNMPIGEVAAKCGFDDIAYFSRVFKQECDMTPSQYRKRVKN